MSTVGPPVELKQRKVRLSKPTDDELDHEVFAHDRVRLAERGITQTRFDRVAKQAIDAGPT